MPEIIDTMRTRTAILSMLISLCLGSAIAVADDLESAEEQAFKEAAARVDPSIVRIVTIGGLERVNGLLTGTGPTTGVVLSDDGYIITSSFNFIARPASIMVQLADGRRFPAQKIAADHSRMLTLLKIDADGLFPVEPVAKSEIRVGQWAIALGRTYELSFPSISVGVVSATNRIWGRALQTDAKVSPVNYGGPLVDIAGRTLGVLVPLSPQKTGETAGVEWYDSGIGFAVPMSDVFASFEKLKTGTDLKPGLLGVNFNSRDKFAEPAVITQVRVESPADRAGIQKDDVIAEVNGQSILRQDDLRQVLGPLYAGQTVDVKVRRGDETTNKQITLVAELLPFQSAFLGILPQREPVNQQNAPGVGIRFVYPDSPAATANLRSGDRILQLDGQPVSDANMLLDAISRNRPETEVKLLIQRGQAERTIPVELATLPDKTLAELSPAIIPNPPDDQPQTETGRQQLTLEQHEREMWAYVPTDYNADYAYGLLVWIHPQNDTMEAAVLEKWKAICDARGIIICGPKSNDLSGWTLDEAEIIKDAVTLMQERYSIGASRIFSHGFSQGGQLAYHLAFKYRDLFRGVAAVGAALRSRPPENDPDYRLQLYLFGGEKDELFKRIDATAKGLRQMKYPVVLQTGPETDHSYPSLEQVRDMARWADSLDRI